MKTATIRQLRNETNVLLDWLKQGESITITKRRHPVARLVPAEQPSERSAITPDFRRRHKRHFPGSKLKALNLAESLADDRGPY